MTQNQPMRRRVLLAVACGAMLVCAGPTMAQKYPDHVIRIVSVASPGTSIDDYTRLLAKFLGERLGQSVVVENRPGANMILASDAVAKSAPDGYTLLLTASSAMSANPFLYRKLPYNPSKDFVPVARMSTLPVALVVPEQSPYKSVADLVAAARAKPGVINGGSSSTGYRLMSAAFNEAAGIKTTDVPYKSTAGLLPDLVGGQVDYSMVEFGAAYTLVQSKKLRALAVLSPNRVPLLPDVPTLSEAEMLNAGLMAAVSRTNWSGLFAPAGTPAAIVERIGKLTIEFVNSPDAQKHYTARGSLANPGTGAELGASVQADQKIWQKMIAVAGIQRE
ncbi:Bug family tripartite tricarboxylate transporter substrate binding protein [Cupriavidus basilensis]|uniref:Bug family tripartite tricarboxylate transporter substrate binding protein n=1 Tax=Cupriavidus basilensis TaxID=68895 RepID=UPI0023E87F6B|nr:tripartite tricarboxylate transporter substrate binding protein [Cupriavidus basilensis]MDF3881562.1 tripartite tricarboxylate transporter substrate binding protein [Cupriavidus basilensis]